MIPERAVNRTGKWEGVLLGRNSSMCFEGPRIESFESYRSDATPSSTPRLAECEVNFSLRSNGKLRT